MGRKSKRTHTTMYCEACNLGRYNTRRNKKTTPKLELNKYCPTCRSVKLHKGKDTKN